MEIKPDLKERADALVSRLQADKGLLESFKKDPIKTLEQLLGVDLPDEKLRVLTAGVKDRLEALGRPGAEAPAAQEAPAPPGPGRLADAAKRALMKKQK